MRPYDPQGATRREDTSRLPAIYEFGRLVLPANQSQA